MANEALLDAFQAGTLTTAFDFLGCHRTETGWVFRVWAPNARAIHVVGDFNFWNPEDLPMRNIGAGIWEAESANAQEGNAYKYLVTQYGGNQAFKADPYGYQMTPLPDTSSVICDIDTYTWHDRAFRAVDNRRNLLDRPINIYEVHLGSWRRHADGSYLSYAELAQELVPYVKEMGYTHVEMMPLAEYPYDPSWGYQVSCYYAPTHRYGTPQQLMELIDAFHQAGIGVIMDWVPAHFPKDEYGLYEFDGTPQYEVYDMKMREHPEWGTRVFNYGSGGVCSFLVSNAIFWLRKYHIDGLRVDAVSSMLYLDYNRKDYIPNKFGGRENLEAIEFLRRLNTAAFAEKKNALMIAEESTTFPNITKPVEDDGLGFLFKWNMGWMHDVLDYMSKDPIYRSYHHNKLTFQLTYAFSENYILPLSHDEVVHGKLSLINRMPGSYEDKFHNLRAMYAYMMTEPGKKMTFMGSELGQFIEWNFNQGLDWMLLDYDKHRQLHHFVKDLNFFYREHPQLWEDDRDWEGFRWIDPDDNERSVLSYIRRDKKGRELIVICNFCPVYRDHFRLGLRLPGTYDPIFNSDRPEYGGNDTFVPSVTTEKIPANNQKYSAEFTLPGMSVTIYQRRRPERKTKE